MALLAPSEVAAARTGRLVVDHGSVRLRAERQGDHIVVVGTSSEALVAVRARERVVLLVLVPTFVALAGIGAWLLVGATLRPATAMAREAERLSVHDTTRRLPEPRGDDEIAALAKNLNALLDRVHATLAADRAFVEDASHELRTPLGVLRGELELAQLGLGDLTRELAAEGKATSRETDAIALSLGHAHQEVERLGRLTDDLLTLARFDRREMALRIRAVELRALAVELARRLGPLGPRIEVDGPALLVNADPDRVEQVLSNLVANAAKHARTRVRITLVDHGAGGGEITVADDGDGIPDSLLPRLFDRFRRADLARRRSSLAPGTEAGTGLGMAIVAAIVAAHDGTIDARNGPPLGGAAITVRLPISRDVGAAPPAGA